MSTYLADTIRRLACPAPDGSTYAGQPCIIGLRTSRADGTSDGQNGRPSFPWPVTPGAVVRAATWNPSPTCGHGIHYLPWGIGKESMLTIHGSLDNVLYQVVRAPVAHAVEVTEDGGKKWKSPEVELVYSGDRAGALDVLREHGIEASVGMASGSMALVSSTGDGATSSSTGDRATSSSTGDRATSSSTGYGATSSSTGYGATSSSTGDRATSSSTGYGATSSSTGDRATSSSTGARATSSSTGDRASAAATGIESVAVGTRVSAGEGGYIVARRWTGDRYALRGGHVGRRRTLRPYRWYSLGVDLAWVDEGPVEDAFLPPAVLAARGKR